MRFGLYILSLMFLCPTVLLAADLTWLDKAEDCQSFQRGLTKFYESLGDTSVLKVEESEALEHVLNEACGARFKECNFKLCEKRSLSLKDDPATGSSGQAPIKTDSLAWLKEPLTCDGLLDQIRARYEPLGPYSGLPAEKKKELDHVLDVSCSARFTHCKFATCAKFGASDSEKRLEGLSAQGEGSGELWPEERAEVDDKLMTLSQYQKASLELQKAIKLEHERLTGLIAQARAQEESEGLEWIKFTVPAEKVMKEQEAAGFGGKKVLRPNKKGAYDNKSLSGDNGGFTNRPLIKPDDQKEPEEDAPTPQPLF